MWYEKCSKSKLTPLLNITCNSTINKYFYIPKIVSDACCDAVAVSMSTDTNYPTNGEYSKQSSTQDTRTFYHNIQSNFYIYWSSEYNSWFVSILSLMIQYCLNQFYLYYIGSYMFILFRLVGISVVHPDFMPYMTPL